MITTVCASDAHALRDLAGEDAVVVRRVGDVVALESQQYLVSRPRRGPQWWVTWKTYRRIAHAIDTSDGRQLVAPALGELGRSLDRVLAEEPRVLAASEHALLHTIAGRLEGHVPPDLRRLMVIDTALPALFRVVPGRVAAVTATTAAEKVADRLLARKLRARGLALPPRMRPSSSDDGVGEVSSEGASLVLASVISTMLGAGSLYDHAPAEDLLRPRDAPWTWAPAARDLTTRELWRIVAERLRPKR